MGYADAVKGRFRGGMWNRYFLSSFTTSLAWPWTRLFVALGMGPNTVTALSFLASLGGMGMIALGPGPRWIAWTGGALIMVGLLWDHSDGQVARLTGRGTPAGGLLDTVLDRWVEGGWVLALGIGAVLGRVGGQTARPDWLLLLAVGAAVYAVLYCRWSMVQKDLFLLRRDLQAAADATPEEGVVRASTRYGEGGAPQQRFFYLPYFFNRDTTLWLMFAVTLSPDWTLGLLVLAGVHAARGLEINWYTFGDLRKPAGGTVARLLDPDYHK